MEESEDGKDFTQANRGRGNKRSGYQSSILSEENEITNIEKRKNYHQSINYITRLIPSNFPMDN